MKISKSKYGLVGVLVMIIISMQMMNRNSPCFGDLPYGFWSRNAVVALEFIQSQVDLDQILNGHDSECFSTRSERLDYFSQSLKWDSLFIIGYGLLFILFTHFFIPKSRLKMTRVCLLGIGLICIFDFAENYFLREVLERPDNILSSRQWMYPFAFCKWTLLFGLSLVLGFFSIQSKIIGKRFLLLFGISLLIFILWPLRPLTWIGNPTQWILVLSLITWVWMIVKGFFK